VLSQLRVTIQVANSRLASDVCKIEILEADRETNRKNNEKHESVRKYAEGHG